MKTRTGSFPIGFRRGRGEWQSDLGDLSQWAADNGLEVMDLRADDADAVQTIFDAGLRLGSIDLPASRQMISADASTRAKAVETNVAHIERCAEYGTVNHFLVMLPEDPSLPRAENFEYMVESYVQLVPALESADAANRHRRLARTRRALLHTGNVPGVLRRDSIRCRWD